MKFEKIICGPLNNNAYVVWDETSMKAVVIDPSKAGSQIIDFIDKNNLQALGIINTHYHFDHVFDNAKMKRSFTAAFMMHGADVPFYENDKISEKFTDEKIEKVEINTWLKDGDRIRFGKEELVATHTPGHSEGSVCLYSNKHGLLFSGDTLFAGTYGRLDLPGGDGDKMKKSLARLANFPKGTHVLPGHGAETTIEKELEWLGKFKSE